MVAITFHSDLGAPENKICHCFHFSPFFICHEVIFFFKFGDPKSLLMVTAAMKLKDVLTPWKKSYDQHRQYIKKQRHYFANKGPSSQSYCLTSGHVWM